MAEVVFLRVVRYLAKEPAPFRVGDARIEEGACIAGPKTFLDGLLQHKGFADSEIEVPASLAEKLKSAACVVPIELLPPNEKGDEEHEPVNTAGGWVSEEELKAAAEKSKVSIKP
jgi:hypothetical protein